MVQQTLDRFFAESFPGLYRFALARMHRDADAADPFIQLFDAAGAGPVRIRYAEIRNIEFTGKDTAAGQSYAVSNLLNYAILAVGFLLALAVLGMDLTKMTVLLGALGVGIGFGLQSVVNNFVSGLILLFERPIHVGDTVQVGKLQGSVRRIGMRASVVRKVSTSS